MKKKVFFVGDGGDARALAQAGAGLFDVRSRLRELPFGIGPIRRHLGYLRLAWHAFRNRSDVDCILVWQQFIALYFLLLSALMPWRRKPVLIYYILYKPAANPLIDWVKFRAMRAMTNARQVAAVYFVSRQDRLYEATKASKRRLFADHPFRSAHIEAQFGERRSGRFLFSGGASNRDYTIIRALADRMPNVRYKVACLSSQAEILSNLPNVDVHADVSPSAFEDLVLQSKAVILPLHNRTVVSGQLVCLAAMQAGKPVFITRNTFLGDWLNLAQAGAFLSFFDSVDDLRQRLAELDDEKLQAMGNMAREFYLAHHDELAIYRVFADDLRHILA